MLVLATIGALTAAGCGSSSHHSTSGTISASASARTVAPALVVRAKGQVLAFVELTVKRGPYLFVVDTGSTRTQVDSTVAKTLSLPSRGAPRSITSLCKLTTQPVGISDWKLGDATLPATTVDSTKTQFSGAKIKGVRFGGTLGSDVLSRFGRVTVDSAGKRLILGGPAPSGGRSLPVKVNRISGEVFVTAPLTIHRKPALYLIDTGAGRTTINSFGVRALRLRATGRSVTSHTAFCSAETFTPVRIKNWSVAGVKLPSTVAINKRSSSTNKTKTVGGLLGLDVLSRFGEVTIDFAGQRLVLGGIVS
jgi:predicted aspartyl protease